MLIIPALTEVPDNPTLVMGWGGCRNYAKSRFMLHKVNIPISNVQDCMQEGANRKCSNKDPFFFFFTEMNAQLKT